MINDNLHDFKSAVEMRANEWKQKSYEECMNGFLNKTIRQSTVLTIPENAPLDTKEHVINESTATIASTAKKIVNNAFLDENNSLHNIDIASEIVNPKNICESVQKLLAEHIVTEADDKSKLLESVFESGKFKDATSEETLKYIDYTFESAMFDNRFDNGKNLKAQMNLLLSIEGGTLVDSIKSDVSKLVTETEAKNSIIREAVSEINDKKSKIEEQINGESDPDTGESEDKKVGEDGDIAENDAASEGNDAETDDLDSLGNSDNVEKGTEGWFNRAVKTTKKRKITKKDLYSVKDLTANLDVSRESLMTTFDETSFSREAAEEILNQFRELDDGIDSKTVPENENTMSTSDGDADPSNEGDETPDTESAESDYSDDDSEPIEINEDVFKYDEEDEIKPDILTEESLAKDFMPLSFKKFCGRSIKPTGKLSAFLAFTPDGGNQFFSSVSARSAEMYSMLSKEDAVCDTISNDDINKKIESELNNVETVKENTNTLMDNMGILGILDGNYQRTDNCVDNAVKSLFKPEIIKQKSAKDISSEELHEHELADILKIGLKINEIQSEIANDVDIMGNKNQLGYLEEILNEKLFELEPNEKIDVEEKIKALQSIESVIPIQDLVNMQVFVSSTIEKPKPDRVTLDSLKDIDAYGFSYLDEIEKIKSDVKKKYKDQFAGKHTIVNFNIDELVEFIVDEKDTTKLNSNLFERVLAKCTENIDITNSSEGLVVLNKARALTTAFVTADKLNLLSHDEMNNIKRTLMYS
jgi:hypothetical protein